MICVINMKWIKTVVFLLMNSDAYLKNKIKIKNFCMLVLATLYILSTLWTEHTFDLMLLNVVDIRLSCHHLFGKVFDSNRISSTLFWACIIVPVFFNSSILLTVKPINRFMKISTIHIK